MNLWQRDRAGSCFISIVKWNQEGGDKLESDQPVPTSYRNQLSDQSPARPPTPPAWSLHTVVDYIKLLSLKLKTTFISPPVTYVHMSSTQTAAGFYNLSVRDFFLSPPNLSFLKTICPGPLRVFLRIN